MNKKIRILLSHVYVDRIKSVPVATKGSLPFRWKILHTFFTTPRKLIIQSYHSQTKSVSTSRINLLPIHFHLLPSALICSHLLPSLSRISPLTRESSLKTGEKGKKSSVIPPPESPAGHFCCLFLSIVSVNCSSGYLSQRYFPCLSLSLILRGLTQEAS